jgi:hypothetical protein
MALILEKLNDETVRATFRIDGRTVKSVEGHPSEAKKLCLEVLAAGSVCHQISEGVYDLTYIKMNELAKVAMK